MALEHSICTCSFGYFITISLMGAFSSDLQVLVTPMRSRPPMPSLSPRTTSLHASASFHALAATGRSRSPASVSTTRCELLRNSGAPNSSSSCLICSDRADCEIYSFSAAREKLRYSATAKNPFICRNSIVYCFAGRGHWLSIVVQFHPFVTVFVDQPPIEVGISVQTDGLLDAVAPVPYRVLGQTEEQAYICVVNAEDDE